MGKGRKAEPNALKVLKGTNQPCRMRDELSCEKITKIPKAPPYMNSYARKVYKITAEQLATLGILDVVNINAVMMYANEMGKYIEAEEKLKTEGRTLVEYSDKGNIHTVRNPLDKMASEYLMNAKMWAVELGVTPASAGKVKVGEKKEKNPLEELLENI